MEECLKELDSANWAGYQLKSSKETPKPYTLNLETGLVVCVF